MHKCIKIQSTGFGYILQFTTLDENYSLLVWTCSSSCIFLSSTGVGVYPLLFMTIFTAKIIEFTRMIINTATTMYNIHEISKKNSPVKG